MKAEVLIRALFCFVVQEKEDSDHWLRSQGFQGRGKDMGGAGRGERGGERGEGRGERGGGEACKTETVTEKSQALTS